MKKTIIILLSIVLLAFAFTSCTNDIKNPVKIFKGESWEEIFEEYWTVMDEEYVHFSYEDTDWDAIYKEYAPLFKDLDYSVPDDCFTAFGYFNHILLNLSDYHYRLIIGTGTAYTYDARPSFLNKWVKKTGKDVDEFPDIKKDISGNEDNVKYEYYSVKEGINSPVTSDDLTAKYIDEAVDGYSEVRKLKENSAFHDAQYAGITFLDEAEAKFPDGSNSSLYFTMVVAPFELYSTDWFVGVTDTGVLYIYFSQFVKPGVLDYFYNLYNYETLAKEEKEAFDKIYGSNRRLYEKLKTSESTSEKNEFAMLEAMGKFATYLNDAVNNGEVSVPGKTEKINGIVIDLRCNGGGYAAFFQEFMGRFFASDRTVGYTQTRIGYSRYDMGPWVEYNLGTYNTSLKEDYQGRVAVITNGFSASCSELTTMTSKMLPNSRRFGSTTFGGTSAYVDRVLYHSGPYQNGSLSMKTTSVRYKAYDGTSYESLGVVPDCPITLNTEKDDRFKAAMQWAASTT